ncbi:MAG: xylulokinase [Actinomycetota bacterium]|nr:xylulokinase [Actinomycetota bacterium]
MNKVVLGVDTSTQSCTVVARSVEDGSILQISKAAHPVTHPPVSEQHPNDWWMAFKKCLKEINLTNVCGISVAGQGHGLVAIDDKEQIIKPAKLWNDTTSDKQSERIIKDLGPKYWADKIGTLPLASFTITKLLWLQDNEPENYKRLKKVILPHDYFNYKFTGVASTDRSEASGTGFMDMKTNTFDRSILKKIGLEDVDKFEFSKILLPDASAGFLTDKIRNELEIPNAVIVGTGANDNPGSALAYGAINEGDLVISFGTSGTAFAPFSNSVHDESGTIYGMAHTVSGFIPLVCTLNSAKVTDLFASLLNLSLNEFGDLALTGSNSANRPILVPWIDGERTPNRPNSRASFHQIDNKFSRQDLARAAFEGVIFGIVSALQRFEEYKIPIKRLIVTGGGSNSPAYLQFLADVMEMPVHVADVKDAAAVGIAIQAAALVKNEPVRDLVQQWAPEIVLFANPRKGQNTKEVLNRFNEVINA